MPGFPVHHQLPELAQTHVHQAGDTIQPPHPLSSPYSPDLRAFRTVSLPCPTPVSRFMGLLCSKQYALGRGDKNTEDILKPVEGWDGGSKVSETEGKVQI